MGWVNARLTVQLPFSCRSAAPTLKPVSLDMDVTGPFWNRVSAIVFTPYVAPADRMANTIREWGPLRRDRHERSATRPGDLQVLHWGRFHGRVRRAAGILFGCMQTCVREVEMPFHVRCTSMFVV